MTITSHAAEAIEAAQLAATTFNRHWGGSLLRVHPDQAPLARETALTSLEVLPAWCSTREVFARLFPRIEPTHGQLVRLGRQLAPRYTRRLLGPRSYYWIAPDDVPPTDW